MQGSPIADETLKCDARAVEKREAEMATELAYRANDGIEVALLWDPDGDTLTVEVLDRNAGDDFALTVEARYAMDAFHHPYAYAAHRGIEYQAGVRQPTYA